MQFPSIDIQGSIISSDLLIRIRSEQANYQQGKNFNKDFTNAKLKDEISSAWQDAKGQWTIFQNKLSRVKEGDSGTTETRSFWIAPLLANLGYNLSYSKSSEEINGRSFSIGHRDGTLEGFPVYVGGYYESLDKRPESKQLRVSPHAMVQEYLNYSEHLYGLVTNGRQLRLLRDASRITRLSYVEFNLEKMMEEDLYSDFVILYRVLHATRMPQKIDDGADSIIEKYHQEGLEAGSTIRNKLGSAVKEAIKTLANGFINHPSNDTLRDTVKAGKLNPDEYYRHQLRVIYRLLFLFVIEERNLVYADNKSSETKRFSKIYFSYYSLLKLRRLAKKITPPDADRHYDLWQNLVSTFSLFEEKEVGEKLGIMSLQGDLFSYKAISGANYDLHQCHLSNAVLLNIIRSLGYFENENKVLLAVNYGGLDVEEFGSVYEGLLELKLNINKIEGKDEYSCSFDSSGERSKSGSHYTPEELVQPLIKHSLEYLIDERLAPYRKKKALKETTIQSLLDLKICDVACGSGHILLSAARRISLEVARVQTDEEQPNPLSIRRAMRLVVRQCIYGVDKNPLAVELCKVALWLEAHNPGEPLNFLDHHIKCGDAIVGIAHREELDKGIADECFKTLPGDDKIIAKSFRDKNIKERKAKDQASLDFDKDINAELNAVIEKYNLFKDLPEHTPEEVTVKEQSYRKYESSTERLRLKQLADTVVAQFFIPKSPETRDFVITDSEYRSYLRQVHKGIGLIQSRKVAYASDIVSRENHFFHWFLEFPEVFQLGGFDCVLGNPPFLGGQKISGGYGDRFLESIKYQFAPIGAVDLVTYFFRRIFTLIKKAGYQSLISTKTISQGGAREGGLEIIVKTGGLISHAVKNMKWPGLATVDVSLITIFNGSSHPKVILNQKEVKHINAFLDADFTGTTKFPILQNQNKSYKGTEITGDGFILNHTEAQRLLDLNPKNQKVIQPYLIGDDLNSDPEQSPSRWVINFFNYPLARYNSIEWDTLTDDERKLIIKNKLYATPEYSGNVAEDFPDCFAIVNEKVKPERIDKNDLRARKFWWQFTRIREELYKNIKDKKRVLVINRHSKITQFSFQPINIIYSDSTVVIADDTLFAYAILNSSIHESWAWKYGSTMGAGTLRYTSVDIFETYPFPQNITAHQKKSLELKGEACNSHRNYLMSETRLGLTKLYNLFHSSGIQNSSIDEKDKQVSSLVKHLAKTQLPISLNEVINGILKLRALHIEIDNIVLEIYGWTSSSSLPPGESVDLRHNFYDVDFLPEKDRVRFTVHPDARKQILEKLLKLNQSVHDNEVELGMWDLKKSDNQLYRTESNEHQAEEPLDQYGLDFK